VIEISDEYGFGSEFPTWIIAYCPDTDSWFCTNKRFFYYEYSKEFECENDAIEYFRNHVPEFTQLNHELYPKRTRRIFLENTREEWTGNIDIGSIVKLKDLRIGGGAHK
jgi:hypothetical protein